MTKQFVRQLVAVTCLGVLVVAASVALAQSPGAPMPPPDQRRRRPMPPQIAVTPGWSSTAVEMAEEPGQVFGQECPPQGNLDSAVWGTDFYTSDSAICPAAVHAGLITVAKGGRVTFQIRGGATSFPGSERNGMATRSWGSWGASFSFHIDRKLIPKPGQAPTTTWTTQAQRFARAATGGSVNVLCPPNGTVGASVWGSDPYTTDSAVCVAAVHAGFINLFKGGQVTIVFRGEQPRFEGTERNGVKTNPWGPYATTFSFK